MKQLIYLSTFFLLATSLSSCSYNSMVEKRESIAEKWAKVESAYQRRADLIPNLVNTVKGAANFEQETFTKIVEARNEAANFKVDPSTLSEEEIAKFQKLQDNVKGQVQNMIKVVVENYPDLKATQNFQELQAQLEGTENRINTERNNFNEAVKDYNALIQSFPEVIYAGWFGFKTKGYFHADAGSDKAPDVKF